MYGSSFCIVTRKPRDLRSRPSEEAVRPLPRLEATPPVTKTCFAQTSLFLQPGYDHSRPYHATRGDPRTGVRYGAGMAPVETARFAGGRVDAWRADAGRVHAWRVDATVLAVVAVVLRLPAFFATRSLVF